MTSHNPGATPLYAAALVGAEACVRLLCEAGAIVNAKNKDGATAMLVSCQEGHLQSAMLLSSYGASRETGSWRGLIPTSGTWAEDLAKRSNKNPALVRWLKASAAFGPLHHVEVLTRQRTLALLREDGCSPLAGPVTPAELALAHPQSAAAALILRAAAPWSPKTHDLRPRVIRARAVEVLKIGYQLARTHSAGVNEGALIDAWLAHVMPHAIAWDDLPSASSAANAFPRAASSGDATMDVSEPLGWMSSLTSRVMTSQRKRGGLMK